MAPSSPDQPTSGGPLLAHLTDADLTGQWLLAGLAAGSAALAFLAGRVSTRRWPLRRNGRRAAVPPEG